jgi:hypothetical protein
MGVQQYRRLALHEAIYYPFNRLPCQANFMSKRSRIFRWLAAAAFPLLLACSDSDTLDPGGDSINIDDRVPPAQGTALELSYPAAGGSATRTWTAPRDDDERDTVDRYEIRYSWSFPLAWEYAVPVDNPPSPLPAGSPQGYDFADPLRGRNLYVAIRSLDASDNPSPTSGVAWAHITGFTLEGRCVDALSGNAIEGIGAEVTERRVHEAATDADGRFRLDDLAGGVVHVALRTGAAGTAYHDYDSTIELTADQSRDHVLIEYIPTEIPAGQNQLLLFKLASGYTSTEPVFKKWKSFPIDVYVPPLVNVNDIDYEDYCRRAVDHWNTQTGENLFRLVDTPPTTGSRFEFVTRAELAPHLGITHHENDTDGFPLTSDIRIVDDFNDADQFWSVALHELGHVVRILHLPKGYLMYAGQPLPRFVTNDEVMVVKLWLSLPNESDLSVYDAGPPE